MSCAEGSTWCRGGRRRAQARPSASSTRKVRLERPPAINVKVRGVVTSPAWSMNHLVTLASLMPAGEVMTLLPTLMQPRSRVPRFPPRRPPAAGESPPAASSPAARCALASSR